MIFFLFRTHLLRAVLSNKKQNHHELAYFMTIENDKDNVLKDKAGEAAATATAAAATSRTVTAIIHKCAD